MATKSVAHSWRAFSARERKQIEARLNTPEGSRCPRCGEILEARPALKSVLECLDCLRFHAREQNSPETLYLLRMQRLATAILRV
jgi:hypothetical protein